MSETKIIDPNEVFVDVEDQRVSLSDLAAARDHVRAAHLAIDPVPMEIEEVRDSGAGEGQFTIRGHATVFNRIYELWPGVRERVAGDAFNEVLDNDPDVHALWDHDTRYVLARTRNKTLELRNDPRGLHYWARVAPTSYAADLRVLMERGDIDQSSFAFTVDKDRWESEEIDGEETITRTIEKIGDLFDVTVTARGANPLTDSSVARSIKEVLKKPGRPVDVVRTTDPTVEETPDPVPTEEEVREAVPAPDGEDGDNETRQEAVSPEVVERLRSLKARRELLAVEAAELSRRL